MKATIILTFMLAVASPSLLKSQDFEIGGFGEIDYFTYFKTIDGKINARNQAILQLEPRVYLGSDAFAFSSVEFREDQADPVRNRVYLDEAYLDLYFNNLDLRVGKQIIIWGKADGINPTDNITPWDFTDVLDTDDERIGVVSLKADYYIDDWTLEGIVVPTFTASLFPAENSRWNPTFPGTISNPMYPNAGDPYLKVFYDFANPVLPDASFNNAQYAVKLSSTFPGWDVSLSYYYGWDDLPTYRQAKSLSDDSLFVNIQTEYYCRNALGGDFSTSFGRWGIRGEAAYYFTENPQGTDPDIDIPYFQYVIGLDRNFSNLIGNNNLFVIIQWIQEIPKYPVEYDAFDLNHVFQKSVMARLELELGTFSKIIMEGVYNLKKGDSYLRTDFAYNVFDGVEFNLIAYFLDGSPDSFFGSYNNNDRIQAKLKYSF